tara:strand:- start:14 stop:631 length:618 start_codon:yes stop_codon:yes gene_type:complete
MSSDLKITNLKHADSASNNLVLASDGSATINQISSSTVFPAGGTGNPISVAILSDVKGTVDAGTATSGNYDPRDLNTLNDPDSFVTVETTTQTISGHTSTYRFTLGAGMYSISAIVPAFRVAQHQSQLYDVTGTQVLKMGSTGYSDSGSGQSNSFSNVQFVHTISANNTYEIRQKVSVTRGTSGLGVGGSFTNNIFTQVIILKLK